jgi:hypothetical protein
LVEKVDGRAVEEGEPVILTKAQDSKGCPEERDLPYFILG